MTTFLITVRTNQDGCAYPTNHNCTFAFLENVIAIAFGADFTTLQFGRSVGDNVQNAAAIR